MKKTLSSFCVVAAVFAFSACSSDNAVAPQGGDPTNRGIPTDNGGGVTDNNRTGDSGHYHAVITSLAVDEETKEPVKIGEAHFVIEKSGKVDEQTTHDGRFAAAVSLENLKPRGHYVQNVYLAASCDQPAPKPIEEPKPDQQTGIVPPAEQVPVAPAEEIEAAPVFGGPFIALDDDLSSNAAGHPFWVKADEDGKSTYERSTTYKALRDDLIASHALEEKSEIDLENRVVVISHCSRSLDVLDGRSCKPIACGPIEAVDAPKPVESPKPIESGKPEPKPEV